MSKVEQTENPPKPEQHKE